MSHDIPAWFVAEVRKDGVDAPFRCRIDALVVDFVELLMHGQQLIDMYIREGIIPDSRIELIAAIDDNQEQHRGEQNFPDNAHECLPIISAQQRQNVIQPA
jgi:hypothetical protein